MLETIAKLRTNIESIYMGDPHAIDRVIACLLAGGHLLIEDVPGVGKTVLASAVAKSIDCSFSRIQLTPDMLPADVLGVTIFDRNSDRFEFWYGNICNGQLVDTLADFLAQRVHLGFEFLDARFGPVQGVAGGRRVPGPQPQVKPPAAAGQQQTGGKGSGQPRIEGARHQGGDVFRHAPPGQPSPPARRKFGSRFSRKAATASLCSGVA